MIYYISEDRTCLTGKWNWFVNTLPNCWNYQEEVVSLWYVYKSRELICYTISYNHLLKFTFGVECRVHGFWDTISRSTALWVWGVFHFLHTTWTKRLLLKAQVKYWEDLLLLTVVPNSRATRNFSGKGRFGVRLLRQTFHREHFFPVGKKFGVFISRDF